MRQRNLGDVRYFIPDMKIVRLVITLRAKLSGAVYCNRSCLWRVGGRCPNLLLQPARAQCLRLYERFFILIVMVKIMLTSSNRNQRYCKNKSGTVFFGSRCTYTGQHGCRVTSHVSHAIASFQTFDFIGRGLRLVPVPKPFRDC